MAIKIIESAQIPKSINKKARARLMKIQGQKLRKMLKNHVFVFEPQTMEAVRPYSLELERVAMSKGFADLLNSTPIKWQVDCYILSREKNGKNKLTGETILTPPCKHPEIGEALADHHWLLVEQFKRSSQGDNFITAAWVASLAGTELTEEQAFKIFMDCGAWSLQSDWEEYQNEEN